MRRLIYMGETAEHRMVKHCIIGSTATFCARFQKEFDIHEWQSLDTHPPTHCRLLRRVLFHLEEAARRVNERFQIEMRWIIRELLWLGGRLGFLSARYSRAKHGTGALWWKTRFSRHMCFTSPTKGLRVRGNRVYSFDDPLERASTIVFLVIFDVRM